MEWDMIWPIIQFPGGFLCPGTNPPFGAISAIKIVHFWTHADLKWYLRETKMALSNVFPWNGM